MALVDRAGRKILLLSGYLTCLVSLCVMSLLIQGHQYWGWNPNVTLGTIPCLFIFQIGFAIGSSISWIVPPELFPQNARGSAMTVVILSRWVLQCLTVLLYLPFRDFAGVPFSYLPFIFSVTAAGIVLLVWLPETKGKSFEEIAQFFGCEDAIVEGDESDSDTDVASGVGYRSGHRSSYASDSDVSNLYNGT